MTQDKKATDLGRCVSCQEVLVDDLPYSWNVSNPKFKFCFDKAACDRRRWDNQDNDDL